MAELIGDKPEPFNVSNPHPLLGKDPNIANEFGHTHYPKYVKDKDGKDVIVNNAKEEQEVAAEPDAPQGWGKLKKK